MKRFFRLVGWLMALGCVVTLVLCYLAYWIPPHVNAYLPLIGLAYPFVMPVVAALAVVAAIFKSRVAIVLSFIWLIGLPHFFSYYQLPFSSNDDPQQGGIKWMSWNVNLLGYNTANKLVEMKPAMIRDSIVKVIKKEQPDILAFQEFLQTEELNHIEQIKMETGLAYHHVKFSHAKKNGRKTGLILFSRYPIIQSGQVPFSGSTLNGCLFVDVLKDGDTMRVYNAHLQSIRFKAEDYEYIDEEKEEMRGATRIIRRLKSAFVRREDQVLAIREHMKTCSYPTVIMGDFNDPPMSYTYHKMKEEMLDAFQECGRWMSSTYAGKFPNFRIDYILCSEDRWKVTEYKTLPIRLVDHRPITASLVLNK